jgi:hypothetical protein
MVFTDYQQLIPDTLSTAMEVNEREDEEAFISSEGVESNEDQLATPSTARSQSPEPTLTPNSGDSGAEYVLEAPSGTWSWLTETILSVLEIGEFSSDIDSDPWQVFPSSPPPFFISTERDGLILETEAEPEPADPTAEDAVKDKDADEEGIHPRDFLRALRAGNLDNETLNGLAPITLCARCKKLYLPAKQVHAVSTIFNGCQHVSVGLSTNPAANFGEDGDLDKLLAAWILTWKSTDAPNHGALRFILEPLSTDFADCSGSIWLDRPLALVGKLRHMVLHSSKWAERKYYLGKLNQEFWAIFIQH